MSLSRAAACVCVYADVATAVPSRAYIARIDKDDLWSEGGVVARGCKEPCKEYMVGYLDEGLWTGQCGRGCGNGGFL